MTHPKMCHATNAEVHVPGIKKYLLQNCMNRVILQ